jgi:hypothetical protein
VYPAVSVHLSVYSSIKVAYEIAFLPVFFSLALQHPMCPGPFFSFMIIFTDGRTPWASDQPVGRPLPKHRATQTQNKHIHTSNIHALSRIRTHDSSFIASEDSSCLRPPGYCDRPCLFTPTNFFHFLCGPYCVKGISSSQNFLFFL